MFIQNNVYYIKLIWQTKTNVDNTFIMIHAMVVDGLSKHIIIVLFTISIIGLAISYIVLV